MNKVLNSIRCKLTCYAARDDVHGRQSFSNHITPLSSIVSIFVQDKAIAR